jgi:glucokinase
VGPLPAGLRCGLDLGGTAIKSGLVEDGRVVATHAVETPHELAACVEAMAGAVEALEAEAGRRAEAVGLAVPGVADAGAGILLEAPNLAFLDGSPVAALLAERLGRPVSLDNDGNAAAWGEATAGAGREAPDFLMVTLGTGVGGGLVLGGRLHHGVGGMAGEFGHVTTSHGRPCGCGAVGCLEAIASARAMETLAAQELGKALPLKELADAAREGDADARAVFSTAGRCLGEALAEVALLLDLRLFLFGGGGAPVLDLLAPAALEVLDRRSFGRSAADFTLAPAALGNDAGLVGAAYLA